MATVYFYKTTSNKLSLNKELESKKELHCEFKSPVNVLKPTLIIKGNNILEYNYVYIPSFNRYYYIESVNGLVDDLTEVVCSFVDVRMTYADGIKNIRGVVARQENVYSPYFVDTQIPVRNNRSLDTIVVDTIDDNFYYYLTVGGGIQ